MSLEGNISNYIKERGINLSAISKGSGIPYGSLYDSLFHDERKRELRGRELFLVCEFLAVDPMDFADKEGR